MKTVEINGELVNPFLIESIRPVRGERASIITMHSGHEYKIYELPAEFMQRVNGPQEG
jgi:hypothetical protein